jgi:two-component system sensor histidine kinase BarA
MGLAIVRKAVEKMGGTLGLESELGKGSTFWFELKAVKELS